MLSYYKDIIKEYVINVDYVMLHIILSRNWKKNMWYEHTKCYKLSLYNFAI